MMDRLFIDNSLDGIVNIQEMVLQLLNASVILERLPVDSLLFNDNNNLISAVNRQTSILEAAVKKQCLICKTDTIRDRRSICSNCEFECDYTLLPMTHDFKTCVKDAPKKAKSNFTCSKLYKNFPYRSLVQNYKKTWKKKIMGNGNVNNIEVRNKLLSKGINIVPTTFGEESVQQMVKRYCRSCDRNIEVTSKSTKKCPKCKTKIMFRCGKCKKQYTSYSSMKYHLESNCYCKNRYQCTKCNFETSTAENLMKHLKTKSHIQKKLEKKTDTKGGTANFIEEGTEINEITNVLVDDLNNNTNDDAKFDIDNGSKNIDVSLINHTDIGLKNDAEDGSKYGTDYGTKNDTNDGSKNGTDDGSKNDTHDGFKNDVEDISKNDKDDGLKSNTEDGSKNNTDKGSNNDADNGSKKATDDGLKNVIDNSSKNATDEGLKNDIDNGSKNYTDDGLKNNTEDVSKNNTDDGSKNNTADGSKNDTDNDDPMYNTHNNLQKAALNARVLPKYIQIISLTTDDNFEKLIKRYCSTCDKNIEVTSSKHAKNCFGCNSKLIFYCAKCSKQYNSYISLEYHIESKCNRRISYKCTLCNVEKHTICTIVHHIKTCKTHKRNKKRQYKTKDQKINVETDITFDDIRNSRHDVLQNDTLNGTLNVTTNEMKDQNNNGKRKLKSSSDHLIEPAPKRIKLDVTNPIKNKTKKAFRRKSLTKETLLHLIKNISNKIKSSCSTCLEQNDIESDVEPKNKCSKCKNRLCFKCTICGKECNSYFNACSHVASCLR